MDEFLNIVRYLVGRKIYLMSIVVVSALIYALMMEVNERNYSATIAYSANIAPSEYIMFCGWGTVCIDANLSQDLEQYLSDHNTIGFQKLNVDVKRNYLVLTFNGRPAEDAIADYLNAANDYFSRHFLERERVLKGNIDVLVDRESEFYGPNFLPSMKINSMNIIDFLSTNKKAPFSFRLLSISTTGLNQIIIILISISAGIFFSTAGLILQYELSSRRTSATGN